MTDDDVRHVTDSEETAEELAALVGDMMAHLANGLQQNRLCAQCALLELLVQTVGGLAAAGVPAADIVGAVGEGLAAGEEDPGRSSQHLH